MASRRIYDVTYPICEDLPVWPGDPKIELDRQRFESATGVVRLIRMKLGNHTGTHVDSPRHMLEDGDGLDRIPLERWIGPARVVALDASVIGAEELEQVDLDGATKVLFKTRNSGRLADPEFDPDYVALDASGARYLVDHGIDLVGIDYLSIETFTSTSFETHHVLMRASVLIIEGLNLSEVAPGDYELLCFPLAIADADGAPARVALRELASD